MPRVNDYICVCILPCAGSLDNWRFDRRACPGQLYTLYDIINESKLNGVVLYVSMTSHWRMRPSLLFMSCVSLPMLIRQLQILTNSRLQLIVLLGDTLPLLIITLCRVYYNYRSRELRYFTWQRVVIQCILIRFNGIEKPKGGILRAFWICDLPFMVSTTISIY